MPRFRRTIRRALVLRVGLVAFAALGALAFVAREGKAAPLTAELCRLVGTATECAGPSQALRTPDLYSQRDLSLAEEERFEAELAAVEEPAVHTVGAAAPQPTSEELALLDAAALRPPAGPEAEEDDLLWQAPRDAMDLALRLARWQELHAPTQPAAPGPTFAAAALLASSAPAGVGVFHPELRTLNLRPALADRRSMAPSAAAPAIFLLGYFSARNGYAGRDALTLRQVPPACPPARPDSPLRRTLRRCLS